MQKISRYGGYNDNIYIMVRPRRSTPATIITAHLSVVETQPSSNGSGRGRAVFLPEHSQSSIGSSHMSRAAWATLAGALLFTCAAIRLTYQDQEDQRAVLSPPVALFVNPTLCLVEATCRSGS